MMKKHLMNYIADKGSVVVNGVCFSNGHGDGMFGVYFTPEKPKYSNIWIDLCVGEIKFKYRGFVAYKCPDCGSELLPCSLCDAWTDNEPKIYAQSCAECPFDEKAG